MMKNFIEWMQSRGQEQLNEDFNGMCGSIVSPKPMFLGSPLRELLGDEAYDEMMKSEDESKAGMLKTKADEEDEGEADGDESNGDESNGDEDGDESDEDEDEDEDEGDKDEDESDESDKSCTIEY